VQYKNNVSSINIAVQLNKIFKNKKKKRTGRRERKKKTKTN